MSNVSKPTVSRGTLYNVFKAFTECGTECVKHVTFFTNNEMNLPIQHIFLHDNKQTYMDLQNLQNKLTLNTIVFIFMENLHLSK